MCLKFSGIQHLPTNLLMVHTLMCCKFSDMYCMEISLLFQKVSKKTFRNVSHEYLIWSRKRWSWLWYNEIFSRERSLLLKALLLKLIFHLIYRSCSSTMASFRSADPNWLLTSSKCMFNKVMMTFIHLLLQIFILSNS